VWGRERERENKGVREGERERNRQTENGREGGTDQTHSRQKLQK